MRLKVFVVILLLLVFFVFFFYVLIFSIFSFGVWENGLILEYFWVVLSNEYY